MVLKTPF